MSIIKKEKILILTFTLFILGTFSHVYGQSWGYLNFDQWRVQQGALAWGDINNDGWLDIVILGNDIDTPAERTRVLFNNKDGSGFTLNQELDGFYCGSVNLVDYDNDGDLDLAINGSTPGGGPIDRCRFRIYKNLGNGNFDPAYIEPVPNWGTWYGNVEWADYDNDGDMDFVICGDEDGPGINSGAVLKVYANQGNGTFWPQYSYSGNGKGFNEYACAVWGDFNNDGYADLVVGGINGVAGGPNDQTFKLKLFINNGAGSFNAPIDIDNDFAPALGYKRISIAVGDFNNDGNLDFAATGHSSKDLIFKFRMYKNVGGGSFTMSDIVSSTFGVIGGSLAAGDYNNDGNLDLALTGYDGSAKRFYLFPGNGNCTFGGPVEPAPGWGVGDDSFSPPAEFGYSGSSLAFADFNNDGDLDIAISGREPGGIPRFRIFTNNIGVNNPPNTPTSTQSVNSSGNWRFQWNSNGDDHTTVVMMKYNIAIRTNISSVIQYSSSNIYYPRGQARVGNVRAGATYYDSKIPWANFKQVFWKVCALDTSFKKSSYSTEMAVIPEWVSSTVLATNRIDLVWRRFNINNATGYTLYRNTSKSIVGATKLPSPGGGTNYSDTTLAGGMSYFYWIKATTTWGTATPLSTYISNRTISILPPQWISATAVATNQINLLWRDLNNETSYTLFRNTVNNPGTASKITGLSMNVTNYSDMTCMAGTTYYYWVQGYNGYGSSGFSSVISTITFPGQPRWVRATAITTNRIDLTWNDVRNETCYTLFRNTANDTNSASRIIDTAANTTNYNNLSGLTHDMLYYYWVRAYNSSGPSPWSFPISSFTFPGPPQWISASGSSTNVISLLWNDMRFETNYSIYRSTINDTNTAVTINSPAANITNYNDSSGLTHGTVYYYWLKARNPSGISIFSLPLSTITRPSTPQWIYAHAVSTNRADLLWRDLRNETCYTLFRNTSNDTATSIKVTRLGANVTNYSDTNLITELTYYYWLKAYDLSGDSVFSDPISLLVGHNIISKIIFPLNNSFIETVGNFKGLVSSVAAIDEEQVLLKRLSDSYYYNGTDWQETEAWITCNGNSDWIYNIITDKIFAYGVQYDLKARGRDIYGLTESKYPSILFTFVYSTDFKESVCNYPNPFYPDSSDASKNTTTIEYMLTRSKDVSVYINAINGEMVKEWKGEEYGTPGLHRIKWNGKNENGVIVGNGVYILIITADNDKQIDKISVIR